jgi:hypothetical protein
LLRLLLLLLVASRFFGVCGCLAICCIIRANKMKTIDRIRGQH